jgi:heat shock protein HslJ
MKVLKVVLATVILLGGVLAFNACQSLESPIEGYNWILYNWLRNGQERAIITDTKITVYFNEKDKTFNGNSGCNQYSGTYKLDGLTLTINDNIAMTEMYCNAEKDEQERLYLDDLKQAGNFVLDHGHLKMYCGQSIMQFQREGAGTTPNNWGE